MSGANSAMALRMVRALQKNMPEFQKNSPEFKNTRANSSLGFSVKVFTRLKSASIASPTWM